MENYCYQKIHCKHVTFLNLFHVTGVFLYSVKIENERLLIFLGSIERDQWQKLGNVLYFCFHEKDT